MQSLNRSRDEIKAIAILWVVFFHAQLVLDGVLYKIQSIGYGGVDMFQFMLGYGLFQSLSKSDDLGDYLKRRVVRIFPSYLPFCLLWLIVMIPKFDLGLVKTVKTIIGNLTMTGYLAKNISVINWYPTLLILSVLSAPLFYAVLSRSKKKLLCLSALVMASLLIGMIYIGDKQYIVISRFPVFLLGMGFAMQAKNEKLVKWAYRCSIPVFVLGVYIIMRFLTVFSDELHQYALYWHPFILIAPALCLILAFLLNKCNKKLLLPLQIIGKASFEIFLFNAWVEVLGKHYGMCNSAMDWVAASLASIVLGVAYHALISKVSKLRYKAIG